MDKGTSGIRASIKENPSADIHQVLVDKLRDIGEKMGAEKVYARSIEDPANPGTWYSYANKRIYRFVSKNNTTAHFNGYIGENSKATVKQMLNKMRQWGWQGE